MMTTIAPMMYRIEYMQRLPLPPWRVPRIPFQGRMRATPRAARPLAAFGALACRLRGLLARRGAPPADRPRLVVFTAIFGGRDTLKEPTIVTPGARYICFTDEPLRSDTWEIVRRPLEEGDPRRTSRRFKLLAHRAVEADCSLWVDGSFQINVDVRDLIARYLGEADLAVYRDLEHDNLVAYGELLIRLGLDSRERVEAQIRRYLAEGLPERLAILPGGVLLRRHTPAVARLNEAWWDEYRRGSVRDMLSLCYVVWRTNLPVAVIDGDIMRNAALRYLDHRAGRRAAEFDPAAWERLRPPTAIAAFPADLTNTALEYAGLYADGWLAGAAFVGLWQPDRATCLVISLMVPLIADPDFATEVEVRLDGAEPLRRTLPLGDTVLRLPVAGPGRRRRVDLRCSALQQLPGEAIPRRVAALLRSVGFEAAPD